LVFSEQKRSLLDCCATDKPRRAIDAKSPAVSLTSVRMASLWLPLRWMDNKEQLGVDSRITGALSMSSLKDKVMIITGAAGNSAAPWRRAGTGARMVLVERSVEHLKAAYGELKGSDHHGSPAMST
jgi:hypothetical protein